MERHPEDDDLPVCPRCGYPLRGLLSQTCPECGQVLAENLDDYRPSRRVTPWSAEAPLLLWKGLWPVLRRPVETLRACGNPRQVTVRRAAAFASMFALVFLVVWGPLREFIMAAHVLVRDWGDPGGVRDPFLFAWRELHQFRLRWVIPSLWLAWAFVRWMVLFGVLALVLPGARNPARSRLAQRGCALLLFSPWFLLLDLMCSMTIWAAVGSCVPEPNSMFASGPSFAADLLRLWLIRLIVPVPLVGTFFFRAVLRWRWTAAVSAGFLLILPAMQLWLAWDRMFAKLNLYAWLLE